MGVTTNRRVIIFSILLVGFLALVTVFSVLAQDDGDRLAPSSSDSESTGGITYTFYLPSIFSAVPNIHDLTLYMIGDGRLYEVRHQDGSQERIQTQEDDGRFFHVKGENEGKWEELWASDEYIFRGTDTSPANDHITGKEQYYTLRENNQYGSPWAPRYWQVGQIFERNPLVSFYNKENCAFDEGGDQQSWLKFVAFYPSYNFPGPIPGGITLNNVIQLAWLSAPASSPIENYFYAKEFGLVGWSNNEGKQAFISEVHQPGTRPPILRESIPCLNTTGQPDQYLWNLPIGILPPPNRAK